MRVRRSLLALGILASSVIATSPQRRVQAVSASEVVALVVEGVGFGHGRGMSQWGAYGRAVNGGQTWQSILDAYYGGTVLSTAPATSRVRVRLVGHDNATVVGVISTTKRAMWAGVGYSSLQARATSTPNRYDIYASSSLVCPGATTSGWTRIAVNVAAPVSFATPVNERTAAAGDVLGLCGSGGVVHYRGVLQLTSDSAGARRLVNDVNVESYLRGVVSREVSTSWGNAGSGRGMNALRAQAVAARSFALASNRYASTGGYATTCDTTVCQAYGGAARRASPTAGLGPSVTCESGNPTFECANTDRAIADTSGRVRRWPDGRFAVTEFSASNGPRTAGGTFPAVDDPWDDVPLNPNHRWTRIIDADSLEAAYGLGSMTGAFTEPDPAAPYVGVWDNRVRLIGTSGSATIGALTLRSTFGFPSHGFTIRAVTRGVVASNSMRFIGDSVGLSMTESSTSELPALLDGVFTSVYYDSAQNRCTSGCGLSGVGAAASVPIGTDLVVVELGYNAPTSGFAGRIDAMMQALQSRQVERVVWINLSERSGRADYVAANQALFAARSRWPDLHVIDWRAASAGSAGNRARWFASDGVHLTTTGQAEMARFVRDQLIGLADFPVGSSLFSWDRQTGNFAIRSMSDLQFRLRFSATWHTAFDFVAAGDFDRDREIDDLFVWARPVAQFSIQSAVNYHPTLRFRGSLPAGYDDAIVGDFDSDGFVNDLFLWDHDTGNFRVYSMSAFRPTLRAQGTWHRAFDTMVVGDWDDDGRLDDVIVWDRDSGGWSARSFSGFASTLIRQGTFPPGYDAAIAGDWNRDGRRDDLALVDVASGTVLVYTWAGRTPTYVSQMTVGPGFDLATAADLDDDGRFNELLVYDRDAGGWRVYRFQQFQATAVSSGTWPSGYDTVLEGEFG